MIRGRLSFVILGAALAAFNAFAEAPAPAPAPPPAEAPAPAPAKIDEQTAKVLRQATDALAKANTLAYKVAAKLKLDGAGMNQEVESKYDISIQRPNKLALRYEGLPSGMAIVTDGEKLYTYVAAASQYRVEDAPDTIADFTNPDSMGSPEGSFVLALADTDPYKALLEGVTEASIEGAETVNGIETQRLLFSDEDLNWQMWISKGDQPRIVRMHADMGKFLQKQIPGMPEFKADMDLHFSEWIVAGELPADVFKFTPPAGATTEEPNPLVGQPAPSFSLDTLDGSKVSLASLKDKVVILDFWATWCPPCREGLPLLETIAKEYADKGVAFYAVNVGEDPAAVRAFLADNGISVPVVLDKEGTVNTDYGVDNLPQTVIIGKDGVVHQVHVGISPRFEGQIRANLNAALRKKS